MNMILRNFFYAVGLTVLFAMQGLDAKTAQFSDLVRIAQSPLCIRLVVTITIVLVVVDALMGILGNKSVTRVPADAQLRNRIKAAKPSPATGA